MNKIDNSSSAIAAARKKAAEKYGDILPAQILARARLMAEQKGWVKRRKEARLLLADQHSSQTQLGDDVYVPVPGQEVGSGARPSWRDPHFFGEMMDLTIKERGWTNALDVASMASRWPEVAGPNVAHNSSVEEFSDDGVLTIRARTVGWETQLRALTAAIDARLAQVLGEGVVKEIIIKGPHQRSWKHGRYSVPGRGVRDTYD